MVSKPHHNHINAIGSLYNELWCTQKIASYDNNYVFLPICSFNTLNCINDCQYSIMDCLLYGNDTCTVIFNGEKITHLQNIKNTSLDIIYTIKSPCNMFGKNIYEIIAIQHYAGYPLNNYWMNIMVDIIVISAIISFMIFTYILSIPISRYGKIQYIIYIIFYYGIWWIFGIGHCIAYFTLFNIFSILVYLMTIRLRNTHSTMISNTAIDVDSSVGSSCTI